MSVDNRYTGVGYEPPFETPSDKDFMAAHIEELESRVRELEAERDRLKHTAKELGDSFDRGIDREDALRIENNKLRARHAALVEAAKKVVTTTKQHIDCDCNLCQLKAALA